MFIEQVINGLTVGMIYGLIAIGFTLIFGVLSLINFAHGEMFMLGAFIAFTLSYFLGWGLIPSFIGGVVAGALAGMAVEKIIFKPLRNMEHEQMMLATLGLSILLKELAILIWGPETHAMKIEKGSFLNGSIELFGSNISMVQIIILVVSILLVLALQLLLYKSKVGFGIRSISQNQDAANLMGVNVDRTINYTFAIGAAMGAAAGVLVALYYGSLEPYMGFMPGIKAFVAMVIGGLTSIPGAVIGGLIIGMSETMAGAYIHSGLQDAIAFLLLMVLLVFRPTGLKRRGS